MQQLFGEEMDTMIDELNEALAGRDLWDGITVGAHRRAPLNRAFIHHSSQNQTWKSLWHTTQKFITLTMMLFGPMSYSGYRHFDPIG